MEDSDSSSRAEVFGVCLAIGCFAVSFMAEAVYCRHKIKAFERSQIEQVDITRSSPS